MDYLKIQYKIILVIVACSFLSFFSSDSWANDKIAFLRFRIDSTGITLTNSMLADGRLRKSRIPDQGKEIYFEVISKESKLLSSGSIENPLVREIEYENPDKTGQLVKKVFNLESAEFTIRINYSSEIEKINFYRSQSDLGGKYVGNSANLIDSVSLTSVVGGENE